MNNKDILDVTSIGTALGAFMAWLPEIACLLAIVWSLIRIYEWARVRIFGKPPIDIMD